MVDFFIIYYQLGIVAGTIIPPITTRKSTTIQGLALMA